MRRFVSGAVRPKTVLAVSPLVALLIFQACGGGGEAEQTARQTSTTADQVTQTEEQGLVLEGLLATTDLSVGANRVAFVLQTAEGLVSLPQVEVTSTYVAEDGSGPVAGPSATASFHLWPFGTRGNYVTKLSFDRAGRWEVKASVPRQDGTVQSAVMSVLVKEVSFTPPIGSEPPLTKNKTLADVENASELTAWPRPDPELYQLSIAEAVSSDMPLVLVMSSPGFCTSPTCGPQADTIHDLKEIYRDQANFIHVEVYDNPQEIQQDLNLGRYSPVVEAWGLTEIEGYLNESWVFILDRSGRIAYKYEGYASLEELEEGLKSVF